MDFERDGFAIVENALDVETVERLTLAVDRVWAEERPQRDTLHLLGFLGRDPAFLELLDHPATFPVVHAVLGWNIYVYHCHLDVHPPLHEPPRWRWHQDGGRQNVELESPRPRLSVKVAYFLTDVEEPDQGALRIVPGSHVRDSLPMDAEPEEATPLLVRAGSAVVFDRRLWHARGDNRSQRTRKALFYGYTYRWVRPRDDLGLSRPQVAALDAVRRQLVGGGTSPIGYWIPTEEDVPLRAIG